MKRIIFILFSFTHGIAAWSQSRHSLRNPAIWLKRVMNVAPEVQADVEAGLEPSGCQQVECTVPDCKLLRIGVVDSADIELEQEENVGEFWCRMTVPGEATQSYMSKLMKEAKKNANFPGFRPGQIPPYARPQMVAFAMEEAINTSLLDAIDSAGLKSLSGDDANAQIVEDIKTMSKTFKVKESCLHSGCLIP